MSTFSNAKTSRQTNKDSEATSITILKMFLGPLRKGVFIDVKRLTFIYKTYFMLTHLEDYWKKDLYHKFSEKTGEEKIRIVESFQVVV